jgi:hypothetical protein
MSRDRRRFRRMAEFRPPTGHVFRIDRSRGPVWYAKYRLPDGRQVQKKIGPAGTAAGGQRMATSPSALPRTGSATWSTRRGADAAGLRAHRRDVRRRRGRVPALRRHDRGCKPSTVRGYRSSINAHLLPAFESVPIEEVTSEAIERWRRPHLSDGRPRARGTPGRGRDRQGRHLGKQREERRTPRTVFSLNCVIGSVTAMTSARARADVVATAPS